MHAFLWIISRQAVPIVFSAKTLHRRAASLPGCPAAPWSAGASGWWLGLALLIGTGSSAAGVDFSREVRPILADRCFKCHGPDDASREADLRLDTAEGATADRGGYRAIAPGDADASLLLERVGESDEGLRMPPAGSAAGLSAAEIDLLRRWIEAGAAYDLHWSFQPIRRPELPQIDEPGWIVNPIDVFVLARLRAAGSGPSPPADRHTLIRRLYLDLLGLLPAPEEVARFVADGAPEAYERLVERVLADPHYGERWGRHWLDQARYADSNGYSIDSERSIWPYRDWVIAALNDDLPFDQFTIAQLAGDLLPEPTQEQLIATGFHRNTLVNQEGGVDAEQFRVEAVVDRVNTTGTVWLGLTIGCAQCHTHKFDPISHREYYQLFAFFNSSRDVNSISPTLPVGAVQTLVMQELPAPRASYVLLRGDFLRLGEPVEPQVPAVLGALPSGGRQATRLDLARWLVAAENPLTARVTVNRVWMRYFGRGLVETEDDFGMQGSPPTHPELLDWLAAELIDCGWSLKRVHRLIVTSATYRQSSRARPDLEELDPTNRLLARQQRLRVEAEIVRDVVLGASGLLDGRIGGPSVYPPQQDGVYAFTQRRAAWPTSSGADRHRRGMYTFFLRSVPYPLLSTFDTPDFNKACTRRPRSNTPLQALAVANDRALVELARVMGRRLWAAHADDAARMEYAFRVCLARSPTDYELGRLIGYLQQQRVQFTSAPADAQRMAVQPLPAGGTVAELAAWAAVARVLINLDEFITRE